MAKPVSDRIPYIVVEYAERHHGSVSAFSISLGHADNWIAGLFSGSMAHMEAYGRVADGLGISLNEFVELIESRAIGEFLKLKIKTTKDKSGAPVEHRAGLARHIGTDRQFLANLAKNDGKLKGLNPYVKLARAIKQPIDCLRKHEPIELEQISA